MTVRWQGPFNPRGRGAFSVFRSAALLAVAFLVTLSMQAQTFTVLHKFAGQDAGTQPVYSVIANGNGDLYGVTVYGGSFNFGTVYRLDATGNETVLHSFLGGDGLWPSGGLIQDSAGNLYGATSEGGYREGGRCVHGCGTVFKIDTTGHKTVLFAFNGGSEGANPIGTLAHDPAGNLYGTGSGGGRMNHGVIFKLDKAGNETVLYNLSTSGGLQIGPFPLGVIRDAAGNLYGMTQKGGTAGDGAVFELDTKGDFSELYSFTGGSDGGSPLGGLVRDAAGNLYGATASGGDLSCIEGGCGVVFKLDSRGTETVLHTFTGSDGMYPISLILDGAGNLDGTAEYGGTFGEGVLFRLDAAGNYTKLHSFSGPDGIVPDGLTLDPAGNLYGTTRFGGSRRGCPAEHNTPPGCGTAFKFAP
jgi:uncharacterized repeat protein (TIGR03803 family)